jgi:diguanylate cyclase (GGDEF)-like protein
MNNFDDSDRRLAAILGRSIGLASQNVFLLEKTEQLAITDSLTGLYNRRYFLERFNEEINRARLYDDKLTLTIVDIDHFKKVNDTYGHPAGDRVLNQLAHVLQQRLRETDFLARYGGEEFVMFFPRTEMAAARQVIEDIRQIVSRQRFYLPDPGNYIQISISAGLAGLSEAESRRSDDFLRRADTALYQAKNSGRNRVVVYDQ